jgi:hypothetical protein
MKLETIKRKYKDEWIVAEILKEDKDGNPIDAKVLAHSKSREETYEALKKDKDKYTYHFYTGDIPKKGYAVAFYEDLF